MGDDEDPDDEVIERWRANMSSGRRAFGGRLTLTARTLSFRPRFFDRATGGKDWSVELRVVKRVSTAERGSNFFDGSLQPRLLVRTRLGDAYFLVSDPDEIGARIREVLGR